MSQFVASTRPTPPILFLIFNRPAHASQVFAAIRAARPAKLFIAADGPRPDRPGEADLCGQCRKLLEGIDWPCEIQTLFRETNLGCQRAVSSAINWFFGLVPEGIILEDDCVPSPSFFPYCAELLEKYRHEKQILSISGSNLGYARPIVASYGFTIFMNMWGWATWADRAQQVDYGIKQWGGLSARIDLYCSLLRGQPKFAMPDYAWFRRWEDIFNRTRLGTENTWDYQWVYLGFCQRMYSIFPSVNLITNTGFGPTGTHTVSGQHPLAGIPATDIKLPLSHPLKISNDLGYERECAMGKWNLHYPSLRQNLSRIYRDLKASLHIT
jgi:hypothetical protein